MTRFASGRHAGVLVPLFSIRSQPGWGIGEIADLPRFAAWLQDAGLDMLQLLPVNEMAQGQNSPYSAMTAMAIDPIYIAVGEVEEFAAAGGETSLSREDRAMLAHVRRADTVQYADVRPLKVRAFRAAFARFDETEWQAHSPRARAFQAFCDQQAWWLDEYTVFRALHEEHDARYWREWDPALRDRDPAALEEARSRLSSRIRYFAWLQWIADTQWQRAQEACGNVGIFGDFPFMVSGDSADVWSRQHEFNVDVSVGVPPDAFSDTGQDWGLPAYRWDVIAPGGYEWLRQRVRRCTELFDGFRIDHLVGFYRTYVKSNDGTTAFWPAEEAEQLALGERLLDLFGSTGARIIAEDLGTVPDFVRESLARRRVPGMKVLRWEREWEVDGKPFRDPEAYPADTVAISGTHDTETLAEWWDEADAAERRAAAVIPALKAAGIDPAAPYSDNLRDALLHALFASGSDILLLPVQDVFGWRDRVNTPAVVNDENWSWRLPWSVEDLRTHPVAAERARVLRDLARKSHRWGGR
ncbi:MAG: 4-alpha-glucanotransferase [Acidobacteria bacterium]|nr:4-alpha-glucanotransferase [Acidobacteriota bacterium]